MAICIMQFMKNHFHKYLSLCMECLLRLPYNVGCAAINVPNMKGLTTIYIADCRFNTFIISCHLDVKIKMSIESSSIKVV
jgi:hypothetical protein